MLCFVFVACSDEPMIMLPDATVQMDASEPPPDAGVRSLCAEPGSMCMRASDCGSQDQTTGSCPGCFPYNRSLCANSSCESHEVLPTSDIHTLRQPVLSSIAPKSFTGHILASTTAGGNTITCTEVYAGSVTLDNPCYNIIDTRRYGTTLSGDVYLLTFSQFPSSLHALFVVHAYDEEGAEGNRIGISCTEYDIEAPGTGPKNVPGDTMRRL
jgi:hypothetical protein